jgi:hypothetical protein
MLNERNDGMLLECTRLSVQQLALGVSAGFELVNPHAAKQSDCARGGCIATGGDLMRAADHAKNVASRTQNGGNTDGIGASDVHLIVGRGKKIP